MGSLALSLEPLPPFRLDLTVWALRRRPENAIDRWDGSTYRRALAIGHTVVEVDVQQIGDADAPRLQVHATGGAVTPELEAAVAGTVERLLGTRVDLGRFYAFAAQDAYLAPLARQFRGLKPPRFPTLFEALANAIACQQVTLTLGIHLLNRLTRAYGTPAGDTSADAHAFPTEAQVAAAEPEALRRLSFSGQKARALIALAAAVHDGRLDEAAMAALDNVSVVARLCQLRGIGRWSAEYALLRGLGRLEVFPGDDVGARKNLARWLGRQEPLDYQGIEHLLAPWRPYGGLIYLHLLLKRLAESGYLVVR